MILLIDLKISNLNSVAQAFRRLGIEVQISDKLGDLKRAKAFVLPGVGAFERASWALRDSGMAQVLRRRVLEENIPVIGICLGMQLLADYGEEGGRHEGLGLIKGRVVKLFSDQTDFLVPNIGWNHVKPEKDGVMFSANQEIRSFYHVHSYHMECDNRSDIAASIEFSGQSVTVAVERGCIFGTQFHPEKSQDPGLDLLEKLVARLDG